MTQQHSWHDTRGAAVHAFNNELPQAATEQAILEHFTERPAVVIALIDEVAEQKRNGKARSGWAIVKARLDAYAATADVTVADTRDRDTAIRNAETWIHNAGVHYDRPEEISAHLVAELGTIRQWHTRQLEKRLLDLWAKRRPAGITVENEDAERAAAYIASRNRVRITDRETAVRTVDQLLADNVPLTTIERIIRRGIPNVALQTELIDRASDTIRTQTDNPPRAVPAPDVPAPSTQRPHPPR